MWHSEDMFVILWIIQNNIMTHVAWFYSQEKISFIIQKEIVLCLPLNVKQIHTDSHTTSPWLQYWTGERYLILWPSPCQPSSGLALALTPTPHPSCLRVLLRLIGIYLFFIANLVESSLLQIGCLFLHRQGFPPLTWGLQCRTQPVHRESKI